jgi:hypothetical protein
MKFDVLQWFLCYLFNDVLGNSNCRRGECKGYSILVCDAV